MLKLGLVGEKMLEKNLNITFSLRTALLKQKSREKKKKLFSFFFYSFPLFFINHIEAKVFVKFPLFMFLFFFIFRLGIFFSSLSLGSAIAIPW